MIRECFLTYRTGVTADTSHVEIFMAALGQYFQNLWPCEVKMAAAQLLTMKGNPYWVVYVDVPGHLSIPHLDKAGLWPHGMTQVVHLRGQVATHVAGWFAGLYARRSICAPPEFLTHSRFSAPDASSGGSQ